MRAVTVLLATLALITSARDGAAQRRTCGGVAHEYGPFDDRAERHAKRRIVEQNRFPPGVEATPGA